MASFLTIMPGVGAGMLRTPHIKKENTEARALKCPLGMGVLFSLLNDSKLFQPMERGI